MVAAKLAGRIGPNAVTRLAEVLALRHGGSLVRVVFADAGLLRHLHHPPQQMVDVNEVRALHIATRSELGAAEAALVTREAGLRTARYLLHHRIPALLQMVLKRTPAMLAARVLLAAIRRHAWTFTGGGVFDAQVGKQRGAERETHAARVVITLTHNPLCRGLHLQAPACDFYAATFEGLFKALVHPRAVVQEVACEACGDSACRFEIRW
jgi:divinyl protochlorophyllide a 8-vinyl-reductase